MSQYKLTIHLKQHTPIIHFQHGQEGATLRATELKPKLDKWITTSLILSYPTIYNHYRKDIKTFFPEVQGRPCGKYKLKIIGKEKDWSIPTSYLKEDNFRRFGENGEFRANVIRNTAFFANAEPVNNGMKRDRDTNRIPFQVGDFSKVRKAVTFEYVYLNISSFNKRLITLLDNLVPLFLANNNFGTRQTKGFGCFSDARTSKSQFINYVSKNRQWEGVYSKRLGSASIPEALGAIAKDYQVIKGGTNYPYKKSLLWRFLCQNQGVSWEKKMVKDEMNRNFQTVWNAIKYSRNTNSLRTASCDNDEHGQRFYYIRALLGLAEHMEFITFSNRDKILVKIAETSGNVQRYASPITFKVFENEVFLLGKAVEPSIQYTTDNQGNRTNRTYRFVLDAKVNRDSFNQDLGQPLEVPRNFNMADFLDFALINQRDLRGYRII